MSRGLGVAQRFVLAQVDDGAPHSFDSLARAYLAARGGWNFSSAHESVRRAIWSLHAKGLVRVEHYGPRRGHGDQKAVALP